MLDVFPRIADLLDEHFADSSIIPTYLVSRFTRGHVKVALGGDGGDEFFLGYPSFLAHKIDSVFGFVPPSAKKVPLELFLRCLPVSDEYMSLNFKARRFLKGLDYGQDMRHQAWIGSFTPREQESLFLDGKTPPDIYETTIRAFRESAAAGAGPLDRAMYIYVKTYMTDDILTKVDRASMANSLEVRAPFLDTDFTGFASGVPSSFKLRNMKMKWILKEALKGRLPADTLTKPKRGFAVPVAQWLKEDLRPLLVEAFSRKKIEREGIFDHRRIDSMARYFLNNRGDTRKEIWALFMFEIWYDKWMK